MAAAARRHYRGLTWLGRARRAGGAPVFLMKVKCREMKKNIFLRRKIGIQINNEFLLYIEVLIVYLYNLIQGRHRRGARAQAW